MEFNIPLAYHLYLNDFNDVITYNYDNKFIIINNFSLFINKNKVIYKIFSNIPLENLLDFLFRYSNNGIRKLYYFLIIKYLSTRTTIIKNKNFIKNLFNFGDSYDSYDKLILLREYGIVKNDCIIITSELLFNICLIINNKTRDKTFIAVIDNNCNIDCLYEIIPEVYNNRFEDITISIIGGSIDNINLIIKIFQVLKSLKLSKLVKRTFLMNEKPIHKSLKYKSNRDKLSFIPKQKFIDNKNYENYYSSLHKVI